MMAGVGPFAIPLGRNVKATVLANDLNPDSYAGLVLLATELLIKTD